MRLFAVAIALFTLSSSASWAQTPAGPYKLEKTVKVGGAGGFDYVNADVAGRRVYFARTGQMPHIGVYNLDTFAPVGDVTTTNAHGAVVDPKSGNAFASSKPLTMFDSKTLKVIKTIEVQGNPDGMYYDPWDRRVYVLSHAAPHITVINAKDGSIIGTLDIGGMPEQAVSDGKGHLYVDVEDKENIAVIDTKKLMVTAHYDLKGKGGTCAGLAMDVKNRILFAACRNPANMVILKADSGEIITTLPIGAGTDGALFNPKTKEAFSSNGGDGNLTIIKENSPTSFAVEQVLATKAGARTSTLDTKTNRVILIAAEFGPATPPAQPGGRAGRGPILPDSFSILVVGK